MLDEATNLVIHEIDHAIINSIREQRMSCSEANFPRIGAGVKPLLRAIKFGYPIADDGFGQISVNITIVISHKWDERRMGIQLGQSEYPRRKCVPMWVTQSKLGVCKQEGA